MKHPNKQTSKIYYRDFLIVPIFILLQYLGPLLAEQTIPQWLHQGLEYELKEGGRTILFNVMMFLAQAMVLLTFIGLHRADIITAIRNRLPGLKTYALHIVIVYMLLSGFILLYQKWVPLLTISPHLYLTIPLSIITIGILTPIVEELLFRHLIIGELGKNWGYKPMAVVSVIVFGASHFLHFSSIWTFIPFIVGGIALTYVYMVSKRNILVSMVLHILINTVSQILGIIGV